jgi:hypothetical protein
MNRSASRYRVLSRARQQAVLGLFGSLPVYEVTRRRSVVSNAGTQITALPP